MRMTLLAVVAMTSLLGCGEEDVRDCPLALYLNGVGIELDGERSTAGAYELRMHVGDRTWGLCSFEVPTPEDGSFVCSGETEWHATGDGWEDVESVQLTVTPDVFTVTLTRDGDVVAEQTYTPEYEVTEPNGEGCGEHISARVTFSW